MKDKMSKSKEKPGQRGSSTSRKKEMISSYRYFLSFSGLWKDMEVAHEIAQEFRVPLAQVFRGIYRLGLIEFEDRCKSPCHNTNESPDFEYKYISKVLALGAFERSEELESRISN